MALIGLAGCGSTSETEDTTGSGTSTPATDSKKIGVSTAEICQANSSTDVNWTALTSVNATNLSEYNLFDNQCDPTSSPNTRGLPYDMAAPLFTDYASKYRFVFVPTDTTATYEADEAFEFPVGSVLTKTFTLPTDTSDRGVAKEEIIETRLLIKRANGWATLPYIWNTDKTDAVLSLIGGSTAASILHDSTEMNFDYGVPTNSECSKCHQFKPDGDPDLGFISPIGPKARYLNSDYDYGSGSENQIAKWVSEGLLSGVPASSSEIDAVPVFTDDTDINAIAPSQLEKFAEGWLDINCAHCHREEGGASNTNFNAEWDSPIALATCNQPISYGGGDLSYIITPGAADQSIMIQRMEAVPDGTGDQMPPLGRALVHSEGTELIKAWLNNSSATPCP